jgi:hypothetical protein
MAIKLQTASDLVPHHAAKSTIVRGAHQLNRSGNEGHGGPLQGGVQASTSGALQRIKRPSMNHIRFIGLKNFPDRL